MIFGHAALAVLVRKRCFRDVSWWLLAGAAFGPDIVDKPAMWFGEWSGRGFGHSACCFLFLVIPLCLGGVRRALLSRPAALAASLLWLAHLPMDAVGWRTFLWPVLGPFPAPSNYSISDMLRTFYLEPETVWLMVLDLVLCGAAAVLWAQGLIARRLERRRQPRGEG